MKDAWGCKIREIAPGIRATMVGIFPFQLVESSALSEDDDILLSSLRPGLDADRLQRVLDVSEAEGILTATLRIARALAQQGVSFDIIKNSTGFTEAELAKLGIVR
ncbi:MAG: hypothetical protein LBR38_04005 [Synergistaceae bacterium]|jgi:hypothetical protein|nr:hypothetical protein [Synergistaceae bacterium]